jgi:hypothetical protein
MDGEGQNVDWTLMGEAEGRRPLGRERLKWVDSINMGIGETGWGGIDWIGLAQDMGHWRALVNVKNEPLDSVKCWKFLST